MWAITNEIHVSKLCFHRENKRKVINHHLVIKYFLQKLQKYQTVILEVKITLTQLKIFIIDSFKQRTTPIKISAMNIYD